MPTQHRHSLRLQGFDYSQPGAYFVTVVTHRRESLFGEVVDGEMVKNQCGEIVQKSITDLPKHYSNVQLGIFVVMPNHIHALFIIIDSTNDARGGSAVIGGSERSVMKTRPHTMNREYEHGEVMVHGLPEIVRAFKSFSARRINRLRQTIGTPVWQRSYYDHVVRNEQELHRIWGYIETNA